MNHLVKKEELVSPGQDVKLELSVGNIIVSSLARALEPGGINDEVRVRDRRTGKVVTGVVVSDGTVEIQRAGQQ